MSQELCKERSPSEVTSHESASTHVGSVINSNQTSMDQETRREIALRYGTFTYHAGQQQFSCSAGVRHLLEPYVADATQAGDDAGLILGLEEAEQHVFWALLNTAAATGERFEQWFSLPAAGHAPPITIQVNGVRTSGQNEEPVVEGLISFVSGRNHLDEDTRLHILELERSNNDLEGFAYVASHDLQEPLRKIVTFADMLLARKEALGDKEGDYLTRIHKSAYDMRALIENLLDYSHIGLTNTAATLVSMDFIVRQSLSDLELKINAGKPVISINPLPELCVDPERMRRVMTNLIGNALKFGKKDETLHINISAGPPTIAEMQQYLPKATGSYTRITIEDNGIGFEKEYEQRIFQIFQRLHGRSSYPGSGLGLAICRKIIEQHQGYIYAEGEKGKGARFHMLLPLVDC